MSRLDRCAAVVAASCLLTASLALVACGGGDESPTATDDGAEAAAAADGVYRSRGEVVALPDPAKPGSQLSIHHEAIPDFASYEGEVVGMSPMTMPFPTAPSLDLAGLEVGDPVAFTLEVRWDGSPPYQITAIEKLPADTELDFAFDEASAVVGDEAMEGSQPPRP